MAELLGTLLRADARRRSPDLALPRLDRVRVAALTDRRFDEPIGGRVAMGSRHL